MKTSMPKIPEIRIVFMLVTMAFLSGCTRMSELISDKNAGYGIVLRSGAGMKAIRFEMNVLKPGTFWIDDLRIERADSKK
jgi:hypothetical protein